MTVFLNIRNICFLSNIVEIYPIHPFTYWTIPTCPFISSCNKFIHHLHCRFFHSSIYFNSSIFPFIYLSNWPIAPIHLFIQFIRVSLSSSWKQVTNQERQGDELVNLRFFLNMKRILQNFMKWSHLREGVWKCSWWRLWPSCQAGVYASRFPCAAAAVSYSSAWLTTWILEDKLHFQFSLSPPISAVMAIWMWPVQRE